MYLSKTQKEIVIKIAKNEISNIYELLKYYKLITLTKTIDNAGYLIKMYNDSFVIDNPEKALQSSIAYKIMSIGMIKGIFTGKKLS